MGIKFDDEICALILLVSLLNSWEPMRVVIVNSIRNATLKFIDVRNAILAEEVRRKDSGEASSSNSALNVDERALRKNEDKNDAVNAVMDKVQDTLFLSIDDIYDS